jgi:hypothetical protein
VRGAGPFPGGGGEGGEDGEGGEGGEDGLVFSVLFPPSMFVV